MCLYQREQSIYYSYIKDLLEQKYNQRVSLPTIIDRAKRNNFYFLRPKRKAHDREVITNYPGELIQHDCSHHLFAPYADRKWYLITSIDDYSRLILYAVLVERETNLGTYPGLRGSFIKIQVYSGLLCRQSFYLSLCTRQRFLLEKSLPTYR